MRALIALLIGGMVALVSAPAGAADDRAGGFRLDGRLDTGSTQYSIRLRVDTERGFELRGHLGAGARRYNLRLRIDGDGFSLDARPGGETPDEVSRPSIAPEDV